MAGNLIELISIGDKVILIVPEHLHYEAVLDKNDLARFIADLVESQIITVSTGDLIVSRLEPIEQILGENSKPSVRDIFENNINKEKDKI